MELALIEGRAVGVSSTPKFFANGEPLEFQQRIDLEGGIAHTLGTAQ